MSYFVQKIKMWKLVFNILLLKIVMYVYFKFLKRRPDLIQTWCEHSTNSVQYNFVIMDFERDRLEKFIITRIYYTEISS